MDQNEFLLRANEVGTLLVIPVISLLQWFYLGLVFFIANVAAQFVNNRITFYMNRRWLTNFDKGVKNATN